MRRDSEVNRICKLHCGTHLGLSERLARLAAAAVAGLPLPPPALVASGVVNACSQQEVASLRQRLAAIHGVRGLALIGEFRTSLVCSCCHQLLQEPPEAAKSQAQGAAAKAKARPRTECCGAAPVKAKLWKPFFWHRDVNAARSILSSLRVYASEGRRPAAFARPAELQACSTRQRRTATTSNAPGQATGRELLHSRPREPARKDLQS